jgi:hypothetical protein
MIVRLCLTVLTVLAAAAAAVAQTREASPPPARRAAGRPVPPVTDVKLDALKAKTTTLPAISRNPFRFNEAPVKVAVPARNALANPGRGVTPTPAAIEGPVDPPPPPPPPPIQLRFIGVIEAPQRAGRVALLSDGKGGLMNGREGDIIEGRYRVLRVGTDSLDIAYADGRGRQTIRLSGQ